MKILYTGCTDSSIHDHAQRPARSDYLTADTAISAALARLGHTLERRWVRPGEDLSDFDLAFVGLLDPLALVGSDGVAGAYYAASSARRVVINPQSAALSEMVQGTMEMLITGRWQARLTTWGRGLHPIAGDWATYCVKTAQAVASGNWPGNWLAILRGFEWMDLERYGALFHVDPARLRRVDPSYLAVDTTVAALHGVERDRVRADQWAFAHLAANHARWLSSLRLSWPVLEHNRATLVSETETIRDMFMSRAALAHPYFHDGGGWWRSRYVYATLTGCVLAGSPGDLRRASIPFPAAPSFIEQLGDSELDDLCSLQRTKILPQLWSSERFDHAVAEIVDAASALP